MSNHSPSTSPSPDAGQEAAPLAWFLALLKEAIVGVMADDAPPMKKASALARLGNLYLKTYATAELERANAELVEWVAEPEERPTALGVEAAAGGEAATSPAASQPEGSPAPSRTKRAKPSKSGTHGQQRPGGRHHSGPGPGKKAVGRRP